MAPECASHRRAETPVTLGARRAHRAHFAHPRPRRPHSAAPRSPHARLGHAVTVYDPRSSCVQAREAEEARHHDAAATIQTRLRDRRERQAASRMSVGASAALGAFRAAAHASLAFAGARVRHQAYRQPVVYDGEIVHAGHLALVSDPPGRLPSGDCYCVLLDSQVLLCFMDGARTPLVAGSGAGSSFDPSTGQAVGAIPIALDQLGAQVMLSAASAAMGPDASSHAAFTLSDGTRMWVARPALYTEGQPSEAAAAVRTWVRHLSATLVPANLRASTRASLARKSATGLVQEGELEADGDRSAADELSPTALPVHYGGKWIDGCYYRGDGSVAFYSGPCADDPYA